ncbi:MAG TPA: polyribonucleotide nucleotidyltransferase [Candidatus Cloacimonas acidaminovorans]|jgi:polyribonucleotide nucleotidyltransferase|nr:polyribonucleotide nucleotidyltransferase [Candidatus Cloacimonas acidaminovorans]HRS60818.1 polyribonucleotide nucleotidyltransferase [Candidatus Cloacimonas sp.]HOM79740.1 polyribonucleotide nucleotidyltransferase [Candidatus Cloacimonas acidaminovorans]HOS06850.1 polyribonucleotide nucleotidyltransferase [Candidatus Cloacimonas acidaminovorans]HOT39308.1 polyribonucleotide nucleotidyltransferase [Candidatus Cloacimonas acidaminovorans]
MHNFNITRRETDFCGRKLIVETGKMAKQANGSVFIQYGETAVLVTATMSKEPAEDQDFFPLTVDYIEKMYAAGKIPGGFFKRESKPSTDATLMARVIDRSIRPLFPEGFRNQVHIVVTVLSFDGVTDPSTMGVFGASLALSISDIPFNGPIASVTVGYIDNQFVVNPHFNEIETQSKLNLTVAGSESSIVMIESAALELSEEMMLDAVFTGHKEIQKLCALQQDFISACGKEKVEVVLDSIPEEIMNKVENAFGAKIAEAAVIFGKQERQDAFDAAEAEMVEMFSQQEDTDLSPWEETERYYKMAFDELIRRYVRDSILRKQHRVDGRGTDDIREITCEIDVLPRVHGSALFTRGETQSLGTLTLGGGTDEQVIDGLETEYKKSFYLHYNFPPYSVGEVGRIGPTGRRELGHGNLAERALKAVLPDKDSFPYTIRIVADTLESNGSSSMASICSGCLALMAGGVPIKAPVAGIAMGLIMEGEDYVVLTDIMGLEDHLGDMDFKCAGTREGITAMQMDIKISGITREIMQIALNKAKSARFKILDIMAECIAEPRSDLAPWAPRIESFKVPIDKIGEIIGPGGKMIKSIIEECQVQIDIQDDGTVRILSPDKESINKAKSIIKGIAVDPVAGDMFEGQVTRIEPYGIFVKILGGTKEGMVHISEMYTGRINHPLDMVKLGDKVQVKTLGMDKGKLSLSMKGVAGNPEPHPDAHREEQQNYHQQNRDDRNRGRNSGRNDYHRHHR